MTLDPVWRVRAALIAALASLAALFTAQATLAPLGWGAAARDPAAWDGQEVVVSLGTVVRVDPGGYTLRKVPDLIPVVGDPAGIAVGDDLSVVGRFRAADAVLVAESRELAPDRPRKKALGAAAVLATLALLPVFFRRRDGGIASRG